MIELAQHIEVLLLENDCVIVPGLGGFVAHYTSAVRVEGEYLFLPPTRTIGFNPQLSLNDGVLVQSYMTAYDTNFSDATKKVEKEVEALIATLHEEGKADLDNVGEIRYTIHNTYEFLPYDNKITTPYLYGLDSFVMKELRALQSTDEKVLAPAIGKENKMSYEIKINRSFLRNAAAMVAAVALFFFMSTPVENTYVEKDNYAQLLPTDLFEKIEKQSVVMTPVTMGQLSEHKQITTLKKEVATKAAVTKPISVKEVKVAKASESSVKSLDNNYHIIVAGGIGVKDADKIATQLRNQGYAEAKVLSSNDKVRVSIMSFATGEEATKQMLELRKNEAYKNAWMLADKK